MAEHTPTPWVMEEQWSGLAIKSGEPTFSLLFKTQRATQTAYADAEFIVRACNAHDDLVAALESCLDSLKFIAQELKGPNGRWEEWSHPANSERQARASLAKARGDSDAG